MSKNFDLQSPWYTFLTFVNHSSENNNIFLVLFIPRLQHLNLDISIIQYPLLTIEYITCHIFNAKHLIAVKNLPLVAVI